MPDHLNAFHPGEWVVIVDQARLRRALKSYRNADDVINAVLPYVGKRLEVVGYHFPQGSGVLYQLAGIEIEVWEECLIDFQISGEDGDGPASTFYRVSVETIGAEEYVVIKDFDGRLYSQTWHSNPQFAKEMIDAFSAIRCRPAFEHRFFFAGDYTARRLASL